MNRDKAFPVKRIMLAVVFVVAASVVVFFVMGGGQGGKVKSDRKDAIVGVKVAPVERRDLKETRIFSGTLEAENQYDAAAKVGGRIREISINLGDCLRRGDLIARLDSEEYELQQAQAQAELAVAEAALGEARNMLTAAERNYQRAAKLREQKVSSVAELESAETEKLTQQAGVNLALAQIKQREAALRTAAVRLSYTTLTADWQADADNRCRYVARRYVDEGDLIAANAPVVTLVDLSLLKAVVNIAERDYAFLRIGQPAMISVDLVPGKAFPGTVVRMAPVFDENSRQARIEIAVPNPDSILKGGMFARVHIELGHADQALAVPSTAIIKRLGSPGVFIVEDAKARFVKVQLEIEDGGWSQVSGLQEGQQAVTLGHHLLSDGVSVAVSDGTDEPPRRKQK